MTPPTCSISRPSRSGSRTSAREQFERWRAAGVTDLRAFLAEDPARIVECSSRIRVVKVNRRTLTLFGAKDADHLVENLDRVFRDDMLTTHVDELAQLWEGKPRFVSQTVNYTLEGKRLDVLLKAVILPGHEAECSSPSKGYHGTRNRTPTANSMHAGCSSIRRCRCGWRRTSVR